tara:strand:+ start:175 stop:396 length:222 start_codon:yes stop_codon:yes gene_type:complete
MPVTEQEEEIRIKTTVKKEELIELFEKNVCGLSNSKSLGDDVRYSFYVYDRADRQVCNDVYSVQIIKTITRQC